MKWIAMSVALFLLAANCKVFIERTIPAKTLLLGTGKANKEEQYCIAAILLTALAMGGIAFFTVFFL